ncbi:hypothetical protein GCM10023259_050120 [Thermocatellispora tengchongensis]
MVAPGFIDLHSHALTPMSMRLQALDGVTTALELEGGAVSLRQAYRSAAEEGRPINYGYSASWAAARMSVLDGLDGLEAESVAGDMAAHLAGPRWNTPGSADDTGRTLDIPRSRASLRRPGHRRTPTAPP